MDSPTTIELPDEPHRAEPLRDDAASDGSPSSNATEVQWDVLVGDDDLAGSLWSQSTDTGLHTDESRTEEGEDDEAWSVVSDHQPCSIYVEPPASEPCTDCEDGLQALSPRSPISPRTATSCSHLDRWNDRDETLIIFDWDDTLCPTFQINGDAAGKCLDRSALELHERVVEVALRAAAGLGHVAIVSMATEAWIEQTLGQLMPRTAEVLKELGVTVSLARTDLTQRCKREAIAECREPSHFLKRKAMTKTVREFYRGAAGRRRPKPRGRSWKNIVSIGDSLAERLALQDLVLQHVQRDRHGRWKECRCKTLKLKSEPNLSELSAQLQLLSALLPALANLDGDVDLDFDDAEIKDIASQMEAGGARAPDDGVAAKASALLHSPRCSP